MPDYPTSTPAIQTDIRLFSTDIQAFTDGGTKDLIIRTTFEPATYTCTVDVYVGDQPGGAVGRHVAQRTIFTGSPVVDVPTPGTTLPDPVPQPDPGTGIDETVPADPGFRE